MKLDLTFLELNELITLYDDANSAAFNANNKIDRLVIMAEAEYNGGPYVCIPVDAFCEVTGCELSRYKELHE